MIECAPIQGEPAMGEPHCHCERSEAIPNVWHGIAAGAPKSGVPDFGIIKWRKSETSDSRCPRNDGGCATLRGSNAGASVNQAPETGRLAENILYFARALR